MEELSSTVDMSKQPELMQRMSKVRRSRIKIDLIHMKVYIGPTNLSKHMLNLIRLSLYRV
jgi:hypothetical protein